MLSKRDLLPAGAELPALDAPDATGMLAVSSAAGTGLDELKEYLWKFVETARTAEPAPDALGLPDDADAYPLEYEEDGPDE